MLKSTNSVMGSKQYNIVVQKVLVFLQLSQLMKRINVLNLQNSMFILLRVRFEYTEKGGINERC